MKKKLAVITIIVLIVGAVILLSFFKGCNNPDYNEELLKLSENFDSKKITLCEEIPVEEIYIPNFFLKFMSRPFFYTDIDDYIKIENVQKTKYGFNIIFKSQNETFLMATNYNGRITNTAFLGETFYRVWDCLKIKEGMSLEEVKKILPDSYLVTVSREIFGAPALKLEEPYMEIVCKNGRFFYIVFAEKDGKYYVENIDDSYFSDDDVIKSWKKLME